MTPDIRRLILDRAYRELQSDLSLSRTEVATRTVEFLKAVGSSTDAEVQSLVNRVYDAFPGVPRFAPGE